MRGLAWGISARLIASYVLVTLAAVVLVEALVLGSQAPRIGQADHGQGQARATGSIYASAGRLTRFDGLLRNLDRVACEGLCLCRRHQFFEPFQLQRFSFARLQINDANRVVIGVGDVEFAASDRKAARFIKPRCAVAVREAAFAGARERFRRLLGGRDAFDFVVIGIGDIQPAVVVDDAERVLQSHFLAFAIAVTEVE